MAHGTTASNRYPHVDALSKTRIRGTLPLMEEHRLRNVLVVFGALVCVAVLVALYWFLLRAPAGPTSEKVISSLSASAAAPLPTLDTQTLNNISAPAPPPKPSAQPTGPPPGTAPLNVLQSLTAPQQ